MRQFDNLPEERNEELLDKLAYYTRRVAELEEAEKHMKEVEEALRESESHLDIAQQMAHVGSWVYHVKTDVSKWSDEMYKIFGIPAHTPITCKRFLSFVYPDDVNKVKQEVKRARNDKKLSTLEYRIVRPDGSKRIIHSERMAIFLNGEPDMVFGADQDITERKKIEDELFDSEKRFRGIFEQAPLGIAVIDSITGRFLQVNPKYTEIIGRTEDEMNKTTFMAISQPDDLKKDLDNMAKLLSGEIHSFSMTKRLFRGDGSIVWVYLTVVPLWDENDHCYPKLHIAMVEDITEKKQAVEALEDAKASAELYLDLMGHDINNMNQIAMGFLEIAMESFHLTDKEKEYLEKPLDTLRNSARLIENVRKIQKLKEKSLKYERIDLCDIINDVKKDYSDIPGRNLTINFIPIHHCYVVGNEFIKEVFSNLVGNAI